MKIHEAAKESQVTRKSVEKVPIVFGPRTYSIPTRYGEIQVFDGLKNSKGMHFEGKEYIRPSLTKGVASIYIPQNFDMCSSFMSYDMNRDDFREFTKEMGVFLESKVDSSQRVKNFNDIGFDNFNLMTLEDFAEESKHWKPLYDCIKSNNILTWSGSLYREINEGIYGFLDDKVRNDISFFDDKKLNVGEVKKEISNYKMRKYFGTEIFPLEDCA